MHDVTFAKEKAPFLKTCVLFKQALAQRFESKMQTGRTQERGSVGPVVLRDLMQM